MDRWFSSTQSSSGKDGGGFDVIEVREILFQVFVALQLHATLVGRRGRPEEIAAVVRFLCGPDARYITGQTLHANGGVFIA